MENIVLLCIVLFIILAAFLYGLYQKKQYRKTVIKKIKDSYGMSPSREYSDGEYAHIGGYNRNHKSDFSLDDITWNDLNMDAVFSAVNYSYTSAGEEYLYYLLRNPSLKGESNEELEKNVAYYADHEEERNNILLALHDCGRTGKYSIYDYLNNLSILDDENAVRDVAVDCLYLIAAACFFFNIGVGIAAAFTVLFISLSTYFKKKKHIEPYITCFSYVFRILGSAETIAGSKAGDAFTEERKKLSELRKRFTKFRSFSWLLYESGGGDPLGIVVDYLRMFFHLDIIKFFHMRNEIKRHWDDIDEILTIIGKIDSTMSVLLLRAHITDHCSPVFKGDSYKASDIYHILLSEPVKNDVDFDKGLILTGSNASGKSTLLKTVAVNAVLAQSINTVMASSYEAPAYRIYTSLALQDNIFEGESYYMTEIKSLKRIMDSSKDRSTPILACVDEVLRGTNTVERISASSVILRSLADVRGLILAATHDLELAYMLEDIYDNYHFEEKIEEDDIFFPYKILKGPATTRNAITLLKLVGYDSEIVEKAQAAAKKYEETGSFY